MLTTKIDARFFESTRGKIILHLRSRPQTVNELAESLAITDNAVRAHLLTLERDGLVIQKGIVKGFRKPHYIYGLAENARNLFPTAYDSLLNRLLDVLKQSLSPIALIKDLRKTGRNIGSGIKVEKSESIDDRMNKAISAIEELGGSARIVRDSSSITIESESCPFAEVVTHHPEICEVTENLISEVLEEKVAEKCDRTGAPKCRFLIETR